MALDLCDAGECRKGHGHRGRHDAYPTGAWGFLSAMDKRKLQKAGFATPRGGAKGAYQNHVVRSNRVIVPFEHIESVRLEDFEDGYVIRLFPDHYFEAAGRAKRAFLEQGRPRIGDEAFVLYRTHDQLRDLPPPNEWRVRWLELGGELVDRRKPGVVDHGEYVLRIAAHGNNPGRVEGPPQGIFAPEYANAETNFISKCILAWLTAHTVDAPYVAAQADWAEGILEAEGIFDLEEWERLGLIRAGHTACPLCMGLIRYGDLHKQVKFADESALLNAADQVTNATRSTVVNLFHLKPLVYTSIEHVPGNVAWGHATCNTKLGQRRCYSLPELIENGVKVGTVDPSGNVHTFGWSTPNLEMIRAPKGAVWIRISDDHLTGEEQARFLNLLRNGAYRLA